MGSRQLKIELLERLFAPDIQASLESIAAYPARQVVNPLFSFLYSLDPVVKWRAVSAMGHVVANLADTDMESARVVMRRMIWNLNDESGGIGWGSPESMGECMARHNRLAGEYHRILVSYIRPDGNFLEHPELQKGLLWGLARLASVSTDPVRSAGPFLKPFLQSADPEHRGLAALAAGFLKEKAVYEALSKLLTDATEITLYWNLDFRRTSLDALAKNALKRYGDV